MSSGPLTYNQTIRGIAEFIEVAIHTILYVRQIYPADLFIRRKKYDTPVFQSRHPALNEYISGAVKAICEELVLGHVDKVVIVIKNKEQVPLERFIFSVENMVQVEAFNKDTGVEEGMNAITLGHYFRSFLVKLNVLESQLSNLLPADEPSFAIVLELKDDKVPSKSCPNEPPPWIPANQQDTTAGTSDDAELHMIRAVDTGVVNFSLAVQESTFKLERDKASARAEKKPDVPAQTGDANATERVEQQPQ